MTVLPIIHAPHLVLRKKCDLVTFFDDALQTLVDDMLETMRAAEGIGLAAPQVGKNLRVVVMDTRTPPDGSLPDAKGLAMQPDLYQFVLINPVLEHFIDEPKPYDEGCLSIPGFEINVERPEHIKITYQDTLGKLHGQSFRGLSARCVQHEIDHLNGVLIVDYTSQIRRNRIFRILRQQQNARQ